MRPGRRADLGCHRQRCGTSLTVVTNRPLRQPFAEIFKSSAVEARHKRRGG
jgi:hypothetical protein